ncbi:MAG: FAD-dependent monooxygenase [bacterium]
MRVVIAGGGPGGLYLAGLLKLHDPTREVVVYERNPPDVTFGFGVVFSDATLADIRDADPEAHDAITENFAHWDDIDVHYGGRVLRSTGHGFSGLSRQRLLTVLQGIAARRGVDVRYEQTLDPADLDALEADVIVAADGVNSRFRDAGAAVFEPTVTLEPNRFVWLGTTKRFPAFTFYFREDAHGLWRVHAYDYEDGQSTFIVECTSETWRRAGMDTASEEETRAYVAALFAEELDGHPVLVNHSIWRQFPTISCRRWHAGRLALLGDAVHTAHFSVGSGTRLAMEGAIALADALNAEATIEGALERYEAVHRPATESLQRAAAVSRAWFEHTERLYGRLPPEQFAFSLLTRSLRITHGGLAERDPAFVATVDAWFSATAAARAGLAAPAEPVRPMFTPFRVGDLCLANRVVVSPMCQYRAEDGVPGDWHLVHLGSRALGGAGLVLTEMTDVSPEGRITHGCTGLYTDAQARAWGRIVGFLKQSSTAAVGIQLGHAGRKAATCIPWEGGDNVPLATGGWPVIGPSALPFHPGGPVPHAMDRADMVRVRQAFVDAARRAQQIGFDLLELHMAHGYLLASFLSPVTNRRADDFGGNLANRMRFPLEVLEAVRAVWGGPLAARISATDWIPGGFELDDALAVAAAFKAAGLDLLDVSTGQTDPASAPAYGRLYQTPYAEAIRQIVELPTMTVGGISSFEDVNSIIAAGRADLCALARVHLFDPYWTRHAAYEQGHDLPWPAPYGVMDRYTPRVEWSPRGRGKA